MQSRTPGDDPVAHVLAGGDETFAAMLERHRQFMGRVAGSVVGPDESEDVVQDAMTLAWRGRATFDGRNPGGWLATIVKHRALSTLRRRHFVTVVLDALPGLPDGAERPDDAALRRELGEALVAALATIPPPQADAVLRCLGDGETYDAVAAASGVAKATIGTRIVRGREKLRGLLGGV